MPRRFRPLEWLWLGSERKRVSDGQFFSPRVRELARRAELAAELADRARRPAEPLVHGNGDALACGLYAESVCWALAAHGLIATETSAARAAEGDKFVVSALWERADRELLVRAAGGDQALERLRAGFVDKSFADFAELERTAQFDLASRLAPFVDGLLSPLRSRRRQLARIRTLRVVRLGGALLVLAVLAIAVTKAMAWNEERRDLARRASWTVSTPYVAAGGCTSPKQVCAESPNYFFHTLQENNPFVVFDLGRERAFSEIVVENRLDCCNDRAVPLVVEVSSDQHKWREVARHDKPFTTWRDDFPRVRARWVRLRIRGIGILHFSRVRILP